MFSSANVAVITSSSTGRNQRCIINKAPEDLKHYFETRQQIQDRYRNIDFEIFNNPQGLDLRRMRRDKDDILYAYQ